MSARGRGNRYLASLKSVAVFLLVVPLKKFCYWQNAALRANGKDRCGTSHCNKVLGVKRSPALKDRPTVQCRSAAPCNTASCPEGGRGLNLRRRISLVLTIGPKRPQPQG